MRNIRLWAGLLLVLVIAAGCGGSNKDTPTATPLPAATRMIVTIPPVSPSPLPPTWTPKPTLTEPVHVTIDYTYAPPTVPTFIAPTYTPSLMPTALPPTETPIGPAVILSAKVLNDTLAAQIPPDAASYIDAAPIIGFADNRMKVSVSVLGVPGDSTSARTVIVEIAISVTDGKIVLSKVSAYYQDDNSPFAQPLADQLVQTLQFIVDDTLIQLYNLASPNNPRFNVSEVLVSTNGLTVRTISAP